MNIADLILEIYMVQDHFAIKTGQSFERSVQFKEEPMVAAEIRESSSPPPPLVVSDGTNQIYDSYMSDNDDLIANPNISTRPKWASKTVQVARELARNPRDPRRSRSQFESALPIKDPCFDDKNFLMVEYDPQTYEYACE